MKKVLAVALIIIVSAFGYTRYNRYFAITTKPKINTITLKHKAQEALAFCKKNRYNEDFCFLVDMSIHSGLNRLFVYDYKKDTISMRMLVGHGCGKNPWSFDWSREQASFSNVDGSHCSALGKYKIAERAYSNWGIHIKYVLHGLEASNSNAESRFIVFHSWEKVPEKEVYPDGTAEGWGCPTISNENMKLVDPMLQTTKKPVLMWIYK
ncbi:murein L,D-transpeptidase catalytic domain-containing protein [Flavobacterium sp.]|uniref:murein L,D-transpeptidase catalytic domain-containing protein n=1 Tax=Flavobacterium sp. TaxID=239 RepID=UPI002487FE82|nr:murein L,D-transpeptidase catalytic domain family protein [Flavobacterium sp.]MDI1315857.1 murein L,D-transpeptidase catalytic domain family protein [Flavobacterium sp.]